MPGVLLEMDPEEIPLQKPPEYGFVLSHQKVELEVDFLNQSLKGRTILTILPQTRDLREIKIDARQCMIGENQVLVNDKVAEIDYEDPMEAMDIPPYYVWDAHHYKQMRERLGPLVQESRANGPLVITIPKNVRVEEVDPMPENAASAVTQRALGASVARSSSLAIDGTNAPLLAVSTLTPKTAAEQAVRFQPMNISISFSTQRFRDGLHFVGLAEGDGRYPHAYTKHSMDPGVASCIFPCIDDPAMRCTWEISVKCARTLGDALTKQPIPRDHRSLQHLLHKKGLSSGTAPSPPEEYEVPLSDEEKLLEMTVVCSGELMNETIDLDDSSKKIATFLCSNVVAPQHIGFAIGPFEQVDLSEFREVEDDEKLGQGQTLPVLGYCLPGRADEVRHTCTPLAHALDYFLLHYGNYPFTESRFVFVDDQIRDVEHSASLSICSTRLLFGEDIIDPEIENVRTLVHAIASQWMGVAVVPDKPCDRWVTVGLSHFMTDLFMKSLCGHNEYSFRQKTLMDKLVKLDVDRPSLYALGETLHLGAFEHDFMKLKAPLVMMILDRRCAKASGSVGLMRVLSRIVVQANTGTMADSVVSTEGFRRLCEKVTKYRQTEPFFTQWVLGAGCPKLIISQKFNKKRLCVEVTITQKREVVKPENQSPLEKSSFMREVKEDVHGIYAGETQAFFTGPLTIRIHEADGTPYEHIVDIKDGNSKIDIPYNTKYKRLKRKNLQKQRQNAGAVAHSGENSDEALYYCLGDVLQSEEEIKEWKLVGWSEDMEQRMDQESYEWIRIDADFEWLCSKEFISMQPYMYVSQLQQDRDVVAQYESIKHLRNQPAHALVSTFLVRTVMDHRYFHGIRAMAAECLKNHIGYTGFEKIGLEHLLKAYKELFCYPGTETPRSNDFKDKRAYKVEMAIMRGLSQVRETNGQSVKQAREKILDSLRFNDNTNNEFSDYFKIANLLSALTDSIITTRDTADVLQDANVEDWEFDQFKMSVVEELDRYRRMDEWINSYQNIFTVTVLDCKQRLMKAKVIPVDPVEFAQYLHDGTSDFVRIKAFNALVDLGFMNINSVTSLLLNVLSTDLSPYTRDRIFNVLYLGLANFALGDTRPLNAAPAPSAPAAGAEQVDGLMDGYIPPTATADGDIDMVLGEPSGSAPAVNVIANANGNAGGDLVVDNDVSLEGRQALIARTTTIEGALAALKVELQDNKTMKDALWSAVKSRIITLHEQTDLLDICFLLYNPEESMIIKMKYPRYWAVQNLGKGVLHFKTTDKIRTKASKPMLTVLPPKTMVVLPPPKVSTPTPKIPTPTPKISIPAPKVATPAASTQKLIFSTNNGLMRPPKRPLAPETNPSAEERPRKTVKLKVPAASLRAILSRPPKPAFMRTKSSSTGSSSPGPRPSPGPKASPAPRASPAPSNPVRSISTASAPSTTPGTSSGIPGGTPLKIRKPLPDAGARKPLPDAGARKPLPDAGKSEKAHRQPLPEAAPRPHTEVATSPAKPRMLIKLKVNMGGGAKKEPSSES